MFDKCIHKQMFIMHIYSEPSSTYSGGEPWAISAYYHQLDKEGRKKQHTLSMLYPPCVDKSICEKQIAEKEESDPIKFSDGMGIADMIQVIVASVYESALKKG